MANRIRGEVPLTLGGRRYTLCLTLGALAELEAALQAGDLAGLAARFAGGRVSARDLIALLGVALRGGGHDLDDAAVARLPLAGGLDAGHVADLADEIEVRQCLLDAVVRDQQRGACHPRGDVPVRDADCPSIGLQCQGERIGAPQ